MRGRWIFVIAFAQMPIQLQLGEGGFSTSLIVTSFWLRRIPYTVCAGGFSGWQPRWWVKAVKDVPPERYEDTLRGHAA